VVNAAARSRSITGILIVLRRQATLELLRELLRSHPLPTFVAASAMEARNLLELFIPDMMVIDLDLENCALLLRDVQRTHPKVDVIAVTDSDEQANLSRQQGIDKVLTSPGKESFIDSLMFLLGVEHKTKHGPHVLLATHDREELVTLTAFLTRSGYEVQAADNSSDAREILQNDPSVRLALLDLQLDDGGIALMKEIGEAFPETGVIMMSSVPDRELARMAASMGAIDYMVRPLKPTDLVDTIEAAIARLDYRDRLPWWKRIFGNREN
jgi:DNA-binding NtrC family response regulator